MLGVVLLAGIWWWGARRSGQAAGNSELRESTLGIVTMPVEPGPTLPRGRDESGEWDVSPLEPLSIRTAHFEAVPAGDLPMMAHADPLDETLDLGLPDPPAAKPPQANTAETQRIVSIRVCAEGESRWSGVELMAAFENHGLAHGRYNVFHRKHSDGRTLFCAASLVEPGVFNLAKMAEEEFRGLTLFAVLPGPLEPLQTLDAVVETAGALAQTLRGSLQDSQGAPLSAQRAEALREDVASFQASLTMT